MRPLAIVKMGATYAALISEQGDFTDWVLRECKLPADRVIVIDAEGGAPLPPPDTICGAILTGSHRTVTDREPWSEGVAGWLQTAVPEDTPLLGICYGHQLIAQALGGRVADNPAGLEFGTVEVTCASGAAQDPLFRTLAPRFKAHTCHTQTVVHLPPGAVLLAMSARDAHQAFRVGRHCWGVQFHPEFNTAAVRFYIDRYKAPLSAQGSAPERLLSDLQQTPQSSALLAAFSAYCQGL